MTKPPALVSSCCKQPVIWIPGDTTRPQHKIAACPDCKRIGVGIPNPDSRHQADHPGF